MKIQDYQARLASYRKSLKNNPIYLQAAEGCMHTLEGKNDTLSEVFLYVYAPTIVSYIEWVLKQAVLEGKKRLYFLARDGFLMQEAATAIVKHRKLDIDIRYLPISRYSIRRAQYYFDEENILDTLCAGAINISFEKLMQRGGLTESEIEFIAEKCGIEEPLSYRQLQDLKDRLKRIPQLFDYIKKHSEAAFENTVGFLKQEGLCDNEEYAIVDSGWTGSLLYSLERVINHASGSDRRICGYFFGLYERPEISDLKQYKTFFFDVKDIRKKVYFSNCLFEAVFSAPEGQTIGYEFLKDAQIYSPVRSKITNPNEEKIKHFASLLGKFLEEYLLITEKYSQSFGVENSTQDFDNRIEQNLEVRKEQDSRDWCNSVRNKKIIEQLLRNAMGNPTAEEAAAFGRLEFCDDVLEHQFYPLAAVWNEAELKNERFLSRVMIKLGIKKKVLCESAWPEGSIVNLNIRTVRSLWQERNYKRFMYIRKRLK